MSKPEGVDDLEVVAVTCEKPIDPLEFEQKIKKLAKEMSCVHDFPKWSPGIACFRVPSNDVQEILDTIKERDWLEHDTNIEHLF